MLTMAKAIIGFLLLSLAGGLIIYFIKDYKYIYKKKKKK